MKQRVGTRLIGGFLIGAAITLLVGGVALSALNRVNRTANDVISTDIQSFTSAHFFTSALSDICRYEKEFFLASELGNRAVQEEYAARLEDSWTALMQDTEGIRQTSVLCLQCHDNGGGAPLSVGNNIKEREERIIQLVSFGDNAYHELVVPVLAGQTYEQLQPRYLDYRESIAELEALSASLHADTLHMLEIREKELIQLQATLQNLVIGIVLAAAIFALFLGSVLTRSITGPVRRLSEITRKIIAGDLTQRVEVSSRDELGELATSFNRMAESLQDSRRQVEKKERELEDANEELRVSNEELRAIEEELRNTNEELLETNEELRKTQEQLVRSEKLAAIGQLAGGVGHELRNPLGAIKNAVYYVRGKVAGSDLGQREPRVTQFLDIVDDEVAASNKIISDLLGFPRVGKPAISPACIDRVIEDALSRISVNENIALVKNLDPDLPEVEIDTDQIRQVLVNILMNAVQAMPGGGKITVAALQRDGFLEVKIGDTGCGIPGEVIGKIFDPLFTTRAKGIGLGLAVSKAIVERHDGYIEVESEIGKGTVFTVKLPLRINEGE
ncbi:MAG: ATP-binding protein [Dehalococcoidales bacterium]|nr:ATP-binding protein [Dehalococcoidales bacterium]